MAVQKNFVIKNGLEVNDNLIFANNNSGKVGIGTTIVRATLEVRGNVLVEDVTLTGVVTFSNPLLTNNLNAVSGVVTSLSGTAVTYTSTNFGTSNITRINAVSGVVTSLTGTAVTYSTADFGIVGVSTLNALSGVVTSLTGTTSNFDIQNANNLNALSGVVTSLIGTAVTYSTADFGIVGVSTLNALSGVVTSLSGTAVTYSTADFGIVGVSTLNAVSGIITNGTITNLSGTISTIGTVQISSGIITATSGIVTYYGDGTYLQNLPLASPGGSATQVQYNDGSSFTGSSNFTFNGNTVTVGSGGVVTVGVVTATDFNSTSDSNLKENITTVDGALDIANQLRGVKFEWKKDHKPSYGVIAQELEKVLPELVSDTDPKTVNYNGIIGVLIEAVKELSVRVKELEDK